MKLKKQLTNLLNQKHFWNLSTLLSSVIFSINIVDFNSVSSDSSMEIAIWLCLAAQFPILLLAFSRLGANVQVYGHYKGREMAEQIEQKQKTHQQLDQLREDLIHGKAEGDKYWSILVLLNDLGGNACG